ncbi:ACT domain-containing protein [Anaerosacchariphilus polymeriproducens]|uniref:ACT domain-containing protein n=1 Tax=Anaerosacchariphilus polymeriproducens TaxID=1812858 RepID=A0A371AWB9_9FIRM|nr:ACT domain-containing protein [Anaerosacchariphilus polymeriproducens]RDU23875.1 ACT domain-containing protein [Anaerosacchariphilus polymeriproducens]
MTNLDNSKLRLKVINREFSICKIKNINQVNLNDDFCFVGKTDEELSLVCLSDMLPKDYIECDPGWTGFRIQGILDFSLVGVLSPIAKILTEKQIGIFVVSTFNTDYILVKNHNFLSSKKALEEAGYKFE